MTHCCFIGKRRSVAAPSWPSLQFRRTGIRGSSFTHSIPASLLPLPGSCIELDAAISIGKLFVATRTISFTAAPNSERHNNQPVRHVSGYQPTPTLSFTSLIESVLCQGGHVRVSLLANRIFLVLALQRRNTVTPIDLDPAGLRSSAGDHVPACLENAPPSRECLLEFAFCLYFFELRQVNRMTKWTTLELNVNPSRSSSEASCAA